jgi:hypothetical protein
MKTIKHIMLATALTIAVAGHAQDTSTTSTSTYTPPSGPTLNDVPGLLGSSYTDVGVSWQDIKNDANDAYRGSIRANVPLAPGFDAGLGYNYWRRDDAAKFRSHVVAADGKFYFPTHNVKPFVGGLVGYEWARLDFQPGVVRDRNWVWGVNAGVELVVSRFVLTPQVAFTDTMENNSTGVYHYGIDAHHWFTERVGGYVGTTFNDYRRAADSWSYNAGVRLRF